MYAGPLSGMRAVGALPTAAHDQNRPAVLATIPDGFEGTRATLVIMRDMARDAVRDPAQIVRQKAEVLTRDLPPRQWVAEIRALQEFVRDDIRYLKDPEGLERVATPQATLEIGQGDCDDKATLLAALLISIGHPSRFVALAFNGDQFSHVLVETLVGNRWMPLETILPGKPAGWYPDGNPRRFVLPV